MVKRRKNRFTSQAIIRQQNKKKRIRKQDEKKEKKQLSIDIIKSTRLKQKLERKRRDLIHSFLDKINQDYPSQQSLYSNDSMFHSMIEEWNCEKIMIESLRSEKHTIRKMNTSCYLQQQAKRREKIIAYALTKRLDKKKTEDWLSIRF
jgi:hypothetical protein